MYPQSAAPGWEGWSLFYGRSLRCWLLGKSPGLNSREDEGGWGGRDWRGSLLLRALPHSSTPASAMGRLHLPQLLTLFPGSVVMFLPLPKPALSQTLCVTLENLSLPSMPRFSLQRARLSGCPGGAIRESQWGEMMESSPCVGSASEPQKYRYLWTMPRNTVCVCRDCHRILAAFNIINS